MSHWLKRHEKASVAAALALLCAVLGVWLLQPASVPGSALARASYDSYYTWLELADGPPTNCPIVIVYIDLESYLRLGHDPAKPWPRELHARLLERLKTAGAKAVVFDIEFDAPGARAEVDSELARSMSHHGSVVLAAEISVSSQNTGAGDWSRTTRLALPIELFQKAAAAWGLGEVGVDDDFVARQHFSGRDMDGERRPSLTWATGGVLELNSVGSFPGSSSGRWFRYYGPPFALPHASFSQVLDAPATEDAKFRDKVVFVGARPMAGLFTERRDEFRSPFHSWRARDLFMPGVEVHATQMLNLLRGDWLTRLPAAAELFVVVLLGALMGAGLLWLRPVPATVAATFSGCAVVAAAVASFRLSSVLFPWLIFVVVQLPVALGGSVLFHSLEWYRTRRRMEAAKRADEARIREQAALIEKAQDAILVRKIGGEVTYANPSAERLFGWTLADLLNGDAKKLFGDSAALVAQRLAWERGEWNGELIQIARSGASLTLDSRWTLLRDEAGQPKELLIISSDVTEKKQLEAESLRMQRMEAIGSLAGGMAHDLNNALAPILMGTQLLRRDAKDENSNRILSLMESSTRRGADMVRQVLLFARGKQGDFERLDLRQLVKEAEKLAHDTFPQNITVSAQVAEDLWAVNGNATQLHQVLLNLCVNARDAMLDGGSLSFAADNVELTESDARAIADARPGPFVELMVSDTGAGIPLEVLPKIFEPFFTTKPEGKGTGLGLSTTARIVKAHGGFMAVQSAAGEGTTFEIYLPRFTAESGASETTTHELPPRGRGELILVADDDEAVRELLRMSLADHGYRVLTAGHGAEAVTLAREHLSDVALLITDREMPVMNGTKAATIIRSLRVDLPVVFLSGEGEHDLGGAGIGPLMDSISKPVELTVLLHVVSKAVKRQAC